MNIYLIYVQIFKINEQIKKNNLNRNIPFNELPDLPPPE